MDESPGSWITQENYTQEQSHLIELRTRRCSPSTRNEISCFGLTIEHHRRSTLLGSPSINMARNRVRKATRILSTHRSTLDSVSTLHGHALCELISIFIGEIWRTSPFPALHPSVNARFRKYTAWTSSVPIYIDFHRGDLKNKSISGSPPIGQRSIS